jgi:hypothetical protein
LQAFAIDGADLGIFDQPKITIAPHACFEKDSHAQPSLFTIYAKTHRRIRGLPPGAGGDVCAGPALTSASLFGPATYK